MYYVRPSMKVHVRVYKNYTGSQYLGINNIKRLTLVYKCMNGQAPDYLINLLPTHPNGQSLRSDNIYQRLIIPQTQRRTFADRSSSFMGPILWNQLPNFLKESTTANQFKRNLKTSIFTQEFGDV